MRLIRGGAAIKPDKKMIAQNEKNQWLKLKESELKTFVL